MRASFFMRFGMPMIADAELAQRMVDVLEEVVDQDLRQFARRARLAAHAMLEQEHVQRQHLEAAERRVGHVPVRIKRRLPRGCHD